jgi:hypothetical protein
MTSLWGDGCEDSRIQGFWGSCLSATRCIAYRKSICPSLVSSGQNENDKWGLHTLRTIVACIQPLIGGMFLHLVKACDKASPSVISQGGVTTRTPLSVSSSKSALAVSESAPDRDSRIKFFAPRPAIHLAILLPSPPRPPAMTYEASAGNV